MDDDYGDDADLLALASAAEHHTPSTRPSNARSGAPPAGGGGSGGGTSTGTSTSTPSKVVQPTPRALPQRSGPSSIIVSTRQKGNPLLTHIAALPWEYGDIVPDYVLGATACALFLSLKYHRLHPEYVYARIRALGHRYNLRVLLVTVDIDNHEEPLRELAKTSLVNDLTLILAWSAREAARYLEAYRTLEHAAPTAIRGPRATSYADRMLELVTTPRGINRSDAVALSGQFGSVRAAMAADMEELARVPGWGEVKVRRWHRVVREPFRGEAASARTEQGEAGERRAAAFVSAGAAGEAQRREMAAAAAATATAGGEQERGMEGGDARRAEAGAGAGAVGAERRARGETEDRAPDADEEEALQMAGGGNKSAADLPRPPPPKRPRRDEPELEEGVAAALAKYRKQ